MDKPIRDAYKDKLEKTIKELNNSSDECLLAISELSMINMEEKIELMEEMLRAIQEDGYIYCDDVRGKNWFDMRDSLLNEKN